MKVVSSFPGVKNPNWKYVYWGLLVLCVGIGVKHFLSTFHDYGIYWEAGQKILRGEGTLLYDRTRLEPGGFYYPYFWAVLFGGFVKLSFGLDKILFMFLFCLSFFKIIQFSARLAIEKLSLHRESYFFVSSVTLFLGIYAFNDSLMNSNIGILLALVSVFSFEFFEKRKFALSGFFLALGIAMKFYPLVLLGYWIWRKSWLVVAWTVGFTLFFLFGTPILMEGWEAGTNLVADNFYVMGRYGDQVGWNYSGIMFQNFTATSLRYLSLVGISEAQSFRFLFFGATAGVVVLYLPTFLVKADKFKEFRNLVFIHALALVPLLTPISWYNMGVFYLPMIAYFVAKAFVEKEKKARWALGLFFVFYSLSPQGIVPKPVNDFMEFWGMPFWGIMALFLTLTWDLFGLKNLLNFLKVKS